jgi:hypothetical protein
LENQILEEIDPESIVDSLKPSNLSLKKIIKKLISGSYNKMKKKIKEQKIKKVRVFDQ